MTRGAALLQFAAAACALLWLLSSAAGVAAQPPAWRCGPDGRVYQQEPCPGGRPVDAADPRSEGERRAARESAKADARRAEQLERDRRARESAARPARATGFNARPVPAATAPASAPPKPQAYRVPGEPRPKKQKTKAAASAD